MMLDVETLFRRHHDELFRYVTRLTGDADVAADAVQEAFARMIANPPADVQPRAWLYRVATNHARESLRNRQRRETLALGAADRLSPEPLAEADVMTQGNEAIERARQALHGLNEKECTILLMRAEGFAHREIADAVGSTTGSIGTMIARALTKAAANLAPAIETGESHD